MKEYRVSQGGWRTCKQNIKILIYEVFMCIATVRREGCLSTRAAVINAIDVNGSIHHIFLQTTDEPTAIASRRIESREQWRLAASNAPTECHFSSRLANVDSDALSSLAFNHYSRAQINETAPTEDGVN